MVLRGLSVPLWPSSTAAATVFGPGAAVAILLSWIYATGTSTGGLSDPDEGLQHGGHGAAGTANDRPRDADTPGGDTTQARAETARRQESYRTEQPTKAPRRSAPLTERQRRRRQGGAAKHRPTSTERTGTARSQPHARDAPTPRRRAKLNKKDVLSTSRGTSDCAKLPFLFNFALRKALVLRPLVSGFSAADRHRQIVDPLPHP